MNNNQLTAYQITCKNGYTWKTNMASHVSLEMAKAYFIGKKFNTKGYPVEDFSEAVSVKKL